MARVQNVLVSLREGEEGGEGTGEGGGNVIRVALSVQQTTTQGSLSLLEQDTLPLV